MNKRTDLALEAGEALANRQTNGVRSLVRETGGVRITAITVWNEQGEKALGKPQGNYITLELPARMNEQGCDAAQELLTQELQNMLPQSGTVLVAGLGNREITPDALGPKCISQLFATRHIGAELAASAGFEKLRPVAALAPGVLGQTGMETAEILQGLVAQVKPKALIVIDALASRRLSRLGTTIQLSDTGIAPGSGVGNRRTELSARTLGVPVIAIGVPTVVDAATLTADLLEKYAADRASDLPPMREEKLMMVTPKEIDLLIDHAAQLIAMGINRALQPALSLEELRAVMG